MKSATIRASRHLQRERQEGQSYTGRHQQNPTTEAPATDVRDTEDDRTKELDEAVPHGALERKTMFILRQHTRECFIVPANESRRTRRPGAYAPMF